jgi:ribosome biogenesis GTPase A
MAKAKRQMMEIVKHIDVVIELADARIPMSSRNPLAGEISGSKPRLLILNKADMADPEATDRWKAYFRAGGLDVQTIDSRSGNGTGTIPALVHRLTADRRKKFEKKGFHSHPDRVLILGIPNVGKSTLINRLAGRRITKVGDRPGVTTAQQWIKVAKTMELLDTPGILWPKFDRPEIGLRLAATGAVKDERVDLQEIAVFLLKLMLVHYRSRLTDRYRIEKLPELENGPDDQDRLIALFDEIGRRRGCLMRGGAVDYDRTSEIIVRDYRGQKFGPMTLEWPESAAPRKENRPD